jgi:protein SCO1/2
MKRRLPFWPLIAALVLLCILGGAWLLYGRVGEGGAGSQSPLAGADIGGPFSLVDQDSKPVTEASFDGRYRLIYFGYTFCPDVCPTDVQKMMQGYRKFADEDPARAERVQPIFVTVDPERDTPGAVKQFVEAFDPKLVGLTGTRAQIDAMLRSYRIYARAQRAEGQENYLVDHSVIMYLMGPGGEPISFLAADAGPEDVAAELDRYVS